MSRRVVSGRKGRKSGSTTPPASPEIALRSLPLVLRQHPGADPARWRASGGEPSCTGCVAHCCRYVAVEIDKPGAKWQFDQILWMLLHESLAVFVEHSGRWYVEFRTKCRALSDANRCSIYETRPQLCRDYDIETCPVWNDGEAYRWRWESAEAFEAFLDGRGVNWRYRSNPPRPGVDPGGRTGVHSERAILRRSPRTRAPARSAAGDRERARSPRR
jgi:hypothetical protein